MLGVVACVLAVVCKRMQQLPTILGPAVHRGKETTHKPLQIMCTARAWPQQGWKSCANGSNIIAQRFGGHGTKEMLGVVASDCVYLKVLTVAMYSSQLSNFQIYFIFQ